MFNEPDEESSRVNSLTSRKETVKKRKREELYFNGSHLTLESNSLT